MNVSLFGSVGSGISLATSDSDIDLALLLPEIKFRMVPCRLGCGAQMRYHLRLVRARCCIHMTEYLADVKGSFDGWMVGQLQFQTWLRYLFFRSQS